MAHVPYKVNVFFFTTIPGTRYLECVTSLDVNKCRLIFFLFLRILIVDVCGLSEERHFIWYTGYTIFSGNLCFRHILF